MIDPREEAASAADRWSDDLWDEFVSLAKPGSWLEQFIQHRLQGSELGDQLRGALDVFAQQHHAECLRRDRDQHEYDMAADEDR